MSYLLHFSGPASFQQTITLKPGGEPVVVGRDPEAAVYLPDTDRVVSRRHLSIAWSGKGAQVTVLSANGINTDQGDYFSGDEVVLGDGQAARIGSFHLLVSVPAAAVDPDATNFSGMGSRPVPLGPEAKSASPAAAATEKDPWAELLSEWSPGPKRADATVPGSASLAAQAPGSFDRDDPFTTSTSWRMLSGSFAAAPARAPAREPDPLAALAAEERAAVQGDPTTPDSDALQSLCRGLGLQPPQSFNFDWERFGQSLRQVVECLNEHLSTRAEAKKDMQAADRTFVGTKQPNPLKSGMPIEDLLHYLLLSPPDVPGYTPADKALQEAAQEARSHQAAAQAAARALAEGAIAEFEPGKLRGELLQGKLSIASVVDNARLWDLYTTGYEKKAAKLAEWREQLFDRYYMTAYLREIDRLRRTHARRSQQRND
ncbi:type VI secretion system-associated FHA domain protein TagH [Ramlibacter henchirensis]|uniref:type VI secretion system-associated FHA domain protein TagH n=1 Tax=Ramlibacter henchirensis TaxID=204072 RepID=UPI0014312D44|nr:type VI secretion system-associated FHA domain protein TagH [Ramlibacter henchirensis]